MKGYTTYTKEPIQNTKDISSTCGLLCEPDKQGIMENETFQELDGMYAALEQAMRKIERERIVLERFGKPYTVDRTKNGKTTTYYRVVYLEDGKRQQCSASSRDKLIDKLYDLLDNGMEDRLRPSATVLETFEKYKSEREKMVEAGAISSQTAAYDESNWNRFFAKRAFIRRPIRDISTAFLEKEFRLMCGDGTKYTKKAFTKAKTLLSGIFQQALIDGIITFNAVIPVPLNKCRFIMEDFSEETEAEKYYSRKEMQKFREYVKSLPKSTYTLGILLHSYIVARIGETRALTWDDFNAQTGELTIWHEIIQERQGEKARVDKDVPHTKSCKGQGRRTIALPDEAINVIEELRKINGDKKYMLNGCRNAKFSIPANKINEHIKSYCEACGIIYRSSHKFRFYGISSLYDAGVAEEKIQYTAGHTDRKMTQHYDKSRNIRKKVSKEDMKALL